MVTILGAPCDAPRFFRFRLTSLAKVNGKCVFLPLFPVCESVLQLMTMTFTPLIENGTFDTLSPPHPTPRLQAR